MALQIASLFASLGLDDNLTAGLKNAEKTLTGFSGKLSSLGGDLQNMGSKLMAATAPIAGALGVGIKAASDFDSALAEISARTGTTGADLLKVSDFALKMGADTVFSALDASEAMLQLLSSGQSMKEAMATLPAVLTGAAAGGMNLGTTADMITDIMAAMKLEVRDASLVVDALARAAGASSADMSDLGQGFANVAGLAYNAKLSVEDTSAILAIFAENGIKGAEAGTLMKSMLLNMKRPTNEVEGMWKKLGISMYDAKGKARSFELVLKELSAVLPKLSDKERDEALQTLAGSYGILGLTALSTSISMSEMKTRMGDQVGASEVAAARMATFSGSVESLKGSIEALAITALTPFMNNILKPMVNDLIPIVNQISEWTKQNPELTATILKIAGAALLAGPLLWGLGAAIKGVSTAIGILLSPAALLLLAIGGIVYYIEKNYKGGFLQMLTDAATTADQLRQLIGIAVVNAFDDLSTAASNALRDIIKFVQDMGVEVRRVAGTIGVAFINIANAIISAFWNVGQAIGNFVLDRISTALQLLTIIQAALGDTAAAKRTADAVLGLKGSNTSPPVIGIPDWMLNYAGGRAMGGAVTAGRSYTVGERGPELFVPGQSGAIIPNGRGRTANITLILRADNFEERIYNNVAVALE